VRSQSSHSVDDCANARASLQAASLREAVTGRAGARTRSCRAPPPLRALRACRARASLRLLSISAFFFLVTRPFLYLIPSDCSSPLPSISIYRCRPTANHAFSTASVTNRSTSAAARTRRRSSHRISTTRRYTRCVYALVILIPFLPIFDSLGFAASRRVASPCLRLHLSLLFRSLHSDSLSSTS
jgi:hypothetical protein